MSWLSFAISVIPRAVGNFAVMLLNCLLTLALNARLALSRCAFGIFFDLALNSLILAAFALRNWASFCFLLLVYCLRACVTPVCLRLPPLLLPPDIFVGGFFFFCFFLGGATMTGARGP